MKTISFIITFLILNTFSWADDILTVDVQVSEDSKNVELVYVNESTSDFFCPLTQVRVQLCDSDYCRVVGSTTLIKKNVYVPSKQNVKVNLNINNSTVSKRNPNAFIDLVQLVNQDSCRPASLNDYCLYSEKTDSELHTLKELGLVNSSNNCDSDVSKLSALNLEGKKIESVKPLSFFNSLESLNLQNNEISNLSGLENLTNLKTVDLDINPFLMSLDPILNLPHIETIWARETGVHNIDVAARSPTLKKVYLEGKTKICEIRYFDEKTKKEIVINCANGRK